ncbi:MAG: serine/threonine-protein kinase [Planctomycetota bacterium]|nr:serine/threonine-protein kinase [Planctomycetota bacterium]
MPRLIVERGNEKGVSLNLEEDRAYVIGRSAQCDLILTDFLVSRTHFQIQRQKELYVITDLESHNGTLVNGMKIAKDTMLCVGDTVRLGETLLSFLSDSDKSEGSLAGQKIGGYHLQTRIGVGGMGEVYKATQISLGRTVALKILAPELVRDRSFVERFLSEARAAGRLNHPNVIGVHEVGEEGGVYFLSMEFVGGGSVQDLISRGRKLEAVRATEIVLQAARALEYAEKSKIVHCDIKPDNLMLTESGEVRLADLGIAKTLNEKGKADQSEGVFGSPHYMAPEQARGLPLDHRADIYSLGVSYWRMLTGKVPFTGKDAKEIMEKQVFEDPEPIERLVPGQAPMVYFVVDRMMRKKPGERQQTASTLVRDLERALDQIRSGVKDTDTTSYRSPSGAISAVHRSSSRRRNRRSRFFGLFGDKK